MIVIIKQMLFHYQPNTFCYELDLCAGLISRGRCWWDSLMACKNKSGGRHCCHRDKSPPPLWNVTFNMPVCLRLHLDWYQWITACSVNESLIFYQKEKGQHAVSNRSWEYESSVCINCKFKSVGIVWTLAAARMDCTSYFSNLTWLWNMWVANVAITKNKKK